jgi:hypothetical protein
MPRITSKKTGHQLVLEDLHKKPIEQIIREALDRHPTPEGAAAELRVTRATLEAWVKFFDIETVEAAAA